MQNKPLTLEELREMDGEPVWCVSMLTGKSEWAILRIIETPKIWLIAVAGAAAGYGDKDTYGKTWIAYRQNPEKIAKQDEPLTLEELRTMDEEPVYIRVGDGREGYVILTWEGDVPECYGPPYDDVPTGEYDIDFYGLTAGWNDPESHWELHHSFGWLAYRRKPEGGTP